MIGIILTNNEGKPILPESSYQPSDEVQELTRKVKQDYEWGREVQNRTYREFNDRNLLTVLDDSQKLFLSYVEAKSNDPDEFWRANTVRPLTRNKIIGIAAQLTARLVYPNIFAQNDEDEEDVDAADVMKSLMIWNIQNSDYDTDFLFAVIQALTSPAVIMHVEFAEAMQQIRARAENGTISVKEVIDDVFSGLQTHIVPVDELFIENIYEFEIQKQRFLIRRRLISFDSAKVIHGKKANFDNFVHPGVIAVLDTTVGRFYDIQEADHDQLVEELTYYNRQEDREVTFVNGILMDDPNQPMKHRDYKNRPKYPFAKSGYHPLNEKRFFYFRSACDDLMHDQVLVDTMWRMTLDGTALSLIPPIATYGDEHITSGVMIPGASHHFKNVNSRIEPISAGNNLAAGYNVLNSLEGSIEQSSQSAVQGGQLPDASQKAFSVARAEANAAIKLGLFGRMIARLVKDMGYLMIDEIIHHQTVGEVEEVTGGNVQMRFRSFLISGQKEEGSTLTKRVEFSDRLMNEEMSEEDQEKASFALLDKEGGMDGDKRLYIVNPEKFRRLRFLITVEADAFLPRNEEFEKALKLDAYRLMVQNPLLDQEAVTKDFLLGVFAKGKENKYFSQQKPDMMNQMLGQQQGQQEIPATPVVNQTSPIRAANRLMGTMQK